MIAIDTVYHHTCLTKLYRHAETVGCDEKDTNEIQVIKAHLFNELIDFGETLAMTDLMSPYDKHIACLGYPFINRNKTH